VLTDAELHALLTAPEDTFLERKPGTVNTQDVRRTLVAFANSVPDGRQAVLFVGIGDKGQILGVENAEKRQREIRRISQEECYPSINIEMRALSVRGVDVVAVMVSGSRERPHFAGPAYVRRGSESVAASREQYEDLIASRHDKARVIQNWGRNRVITVVEDRYRLGKGRVVGEWYARPECMLLECDAHTVRLQILGSGETHRVSLRQVEIGYDDAKNRPQLTVGP